LLIKTQDIDYKNVTKDSHILQFWIHERIPIKKGDFEPSPGDPIN